MRSWIVIGVPSLTLARPHSSKPLSARCWRSSRPKSLALLSDHTPITPRNAINASFTIETVGGEQRWVFQDVLPGGVASSAGARPGDVLLSINGRSVAPTAQDRSGPQFEMQQRIPIVISRNSPAQEMALTLGTPEPKYKDNPYAEPTALYAETQTWRHRLPEGQSLSGENRDRFCEST